MPELPEVEAARRLLERTIVGKVVIGVRAAPDAKIFKQVIDDNDSSDAAIDPASLSDHLHNELARNPRVDCVCRHGKQLWLEFEKAKWPPRKSTPTMFHCSLAMHLGMTGFMAVRGEPRVAYVNTDTGDVDTWPPRFTKLELDLVPDAKDKSEVTAVAFADARRFGSVKLLRGRKGDDALLAGLGPDGLDMPDSFPTTLVTRGGRRPIKSALLDQALLAGVGNWVADEVLLTARVHPEARACDLSPAQAAAVTAAVKSVCETAVAVDADAERYPPDWLFHVRWDQKPGTKIAGHPVAWTTIGGRTTTYVPALQKKTDIKTEVKPEGGVAPPPARARPTRGLGIKK